MTRPCPHCKNGQRPYERDERGWPVSWVRCTSCRGTARRTSVRALNEAVKGNTRA